jgi:hypothetical protein
MLEVGWFYIGSYQLRASSGRYYIHVPAKLVSRFAHRRVNVLVQVDAPNCPDIHGVRAMYPSMLVKTGGTFRINIPTKFTRLALRVQECGGHLDVWISPL